jgi:formate hydrogenlyase subunit 3/multisubunit Na+/H+ antiporter MnhD subunit
VSNLLTLIVVLPLAGFLLNGLAGNRLGKAFVSAVGCGLPALSFAAAVAAFRTLEATGEPIVDVVFRWALIGDSAFEVSFYLDRLSAVMTLIVTGVGSLIHVYSTGYMKDDASYARYFAYLNLFLFFMLSLVLGRSLLVLFVGWEGVGLASYLLIGFWFEDPAKAQAGKKAFITNRVGDAGFLLGMFLIYTAVGTLEMDRVNAAFMGPELPAVSASLVGILLFIGATGKSAQIPLHVWLPDAMAGPTPVSALIHAATMVTAGVYLVARLSGVYLHAPEASEVVAVIGVLTAFFAATIAVVQTDIKKVLAYSTISQLGFMFLALGVGAYGVAVFHLYTHAFFKACLFLGAGSVIHAMGGEQDILQGRDPVVRLRERGRRGPLALGARQPDGAADGVLHVQTAVADVLRPAADGRGDGAPHPRVAVEHDRHPRRAGVPVDRGRVRLDPALPRADAAIAGHKRAPAPLRDAADRRRGADRARGPRGGRLALRRRRLARGATRRALHRPAPAAVGQVLRRRALRGRPRPAAVVDLGPDLPALRRPRADRRHAPRPRGRGASRRRGACADPDGQPSPVRVARAHRHLRAAVVELRPCLSPPC